MSGIITVNINVWILLRHTCLLCPGPACMLSVPSTIIHDSLVCISSILLLRDQSRQLDLILKIEMPLSMLTTIT